MVRRMSFRVMLLVSVQWLLGVVVVVVLLIS
jgi:hypothetical protein